MKLALCTCVKDEGPYLEEWLDFHREQGVDTFYMFDNESSDDTQAILLRQADVVYHRWLGKGVQLAANQHALVYYSYDWMAFIDADEFLYSPLGAKLPDVLKLFEQPTIGAVVVHWMLYGATENADVTIPVTERCTMRDQRPSRYVKTICRSSGHSSPFNSHRFLHSSGYYSVNEKGQRIECNEMSDYPTTDLLRINHYAIKSEPEFQKKFTRRRARLGDPNCEERYRAMHDKRIIDDRGYCYRWGRDYRLKFSEDVTITNKPAGCNQHPTGSNR